MAWGTERVVLTRTRTRPSFKIQRSNDVKPKVTADPRVRDVQILQGGSERGGWVLYMSERGHADASSRGDGNHQNAFRRRASVFALRIASYAEDRRSRASAAATRVTRHCTAPTPSTRAARPPKTTYHKNLTTTRSSPPTFYICRRTVWPTASCPSTPTRHHHGSRGSRP